MRSDIVIGGVKMRYWIRKFEATMWLIIKIILYLSLLGVFMNTILSFIMRSDIVIGGVKMRYWIRKFEATMWLIIKIILYLSLLGVFMMILSKENPSCDIVIGGVKMRYWIRKFEATMWLIIKIILYLSLLGVFMMILSKENPSLMRLSRTMGITITTFVIVGILFLKIYGMYDVGRRKSKPIIYSISLATFFTDAIVYLQLMIMNTYIFNQFGNIFYGCNCIFTTDDYEHDYS